MLACQVDVCPEIDEPPDHPTERDSDRTANQTHGAGLSEEKATHIRVAGPEGLHDSNFAPAFKDGHHQGIHDTDGGHGEGEASEDRKKPVEHGKELAHTASRVDDRESAESHLLDGIFDGRYLIGVSHPHAEGSIG